MLIWIYVDVAHENELVQNTNGWGQAFMRYMKPFFKLKKDTWSLILVNSYLTSRSRCTNFMICTLLKFNAFWADHDSTAGKIWINMNGIYVDTEIKLSSHIINFPPIN